ncbi:putative powdery mildew resistance protein, RPW8 [Helianthus annuus]|nr:putative powdery mildew resistance protein, RPW8 [Helianthus annuus]
MVVEIQTVLRQAFEETLKVVVAEAIQIVRFKTILKRLESTLKSIEPVFYENWRLMKVLDRPQKETFMFISYLKTGKKLVLKSSSVTFQNRYQIILHSYKLIRLNNELVRFFQKELQVNIAIEINECFMDLDSHPGDEAFSSNGYDLTAPPKDEELTLDITSQNYSLPEYINRMDQLKVLSITGRCNHPSKLHNLSPIACLPNLTTIRFEHVSVPSLQPIFALRNLKQLSFVMCEISDALMSITTYNMLLNLTHLEFDMCYDLKELPSWISNLAHLQKLIITNCHEIDVLPNGTGGLSNLESLSLHSCTKLKELPASIGSLRGLSYIDISDCLSIGVLPEEIGELSGLQVLKMNGCTGLQELPLSTSELSGLEEVICDEETSYLWMEFESDLPNLKINVVEDDRSESFMKIVQ